MLQGVRIRPRYIYYPEINLEELYDHDNDPKEWDNIAYKKGNKGIIDEHRKVLLDMLPQLTWRAGPRMAIRLIWIEMYSFAS